ncbi:MAG: LamG domain-containing protein, partial [Gemmataceae bacterium]|nr:LamG domain-containing protein [Gemmataceae bacterium]
MSLWGPVNSSSPIDWSHPLNRGRLLWGCGLAPGGPALRDLRGRFPATLVASPSWVPTGRGDFGLQLNGTSQYLTLAADPVAGLSTFSIGIWALMATGTVGSGMLWDTYDGGTGNGVRIELDGNTPSKMKLRKFVAYASGTVTADNAFPAGEWVRVLMTCSPAGVLAMYLNGVQQSGTATQSGAIGTTAPGIGATRTGGAQWWPSGVSSTGRIGDWAAWNRALTAAEAFADYDLGRRFYPGPLRRAGPLASPPAAAGVSVRSTAVSQGTGSGNVSLPAGAQSGDLLLLLVAVDEQSAPSMPGGWTLAGANTNPGEAWFVFTATASGGGGTAAITVPVAAGTPSWNATCYALTGYSGAVYSSARGATASSSSGVCPTLTAAGSGSLLVSGYGAADPAAGGAVATVTVNAGQTATTNQQNAAASGLSSRTGYETVAAGATGTRTGTATGTWDWPTVSVLVVASGFAPDPATFHVRSQLPQLPALPRVVQPIVRSAPWLPVAAAVPAMPLEMTDYRPDRPARPVYGGTVWSPVPVQASAASGYRPLSVTAGQFQYQAKTSPILATAAATPDRVSGQGADFGGPGRQILATGQVVYPSLVIPTAVPTWGLNQAFAPVVPAGPPQHTGLNARPVALPPPPPPPPVITWFAPATQLAGQS